jgi:hypothetical protein
VIRLRYALLGILLGLLTSARAQESVLTEKLRSAQALFRQAQARQDTRLMGEASYRMGKIYQSWNQYRTSRYWFLQAMRYWEGRGPSEDVVKLYIQLSANYGAVKQHAEWLQCAHKAMATARHVRTADSSRALLRAYGFLCAVHAQHLPELRAHLSVDSSSYYFKRAEQVFRQAGDTTHVADLQGLQEIYEVARQDFKRAGAFSRARLETFRQQGHSHNQVTTQLDLARLSLQSNEFRETERLLDAAQRDYTRFSLEHPDLLSGLELLRAELYRRTHRYQLADIHQRRAYEWEVRRLHADRDAAISRLNVEYETEKRNAQLKSQARELTLQSAALKAEQNRNKTVITPCWAC